MATRAVVAAGWLGLASVAAAQSQRAEEHQVPPPPGTAGGKKGAPSQIAVPPVPPAGPAEAAVRGRFRAPAAAGGETTRVAQARLVSLADGTARLQFPDGSSDLVKPGSVIGGDVVRSVQARQIVLDRPLVAGDPRGEGLVVATFGADGRARVRVFWTKDPSADAAAEAR